MKKMIMFIASAAMIACNAAQLSPKPCLECGGEINDAECDAIVFKVIGSGKSVATTDGDYKTVKTMKIVKGALALTGNYCSDTGTCCYDSGMFYATVKVGKKVIAVESEIVPTVWSVFGKNLDKTRNVTMKVGKKYKLDSALMIESESVETDADASDIMFAASAFGNVSVIVPKAKAGGTCYVSSQTCDPTYVPGTYSGWFVGRCSCLGEEDCFLCECADTDVFGGTWKATYVSSAKTLGAARGIAGVKELE